MLSRPKNKTVVLTCAILAGTLLILHPAYALGLPTGDDIAGVIASIANLFASLLAGLITQVIAYLIPVMLYNNFSNSPVVTQGWALVRDTVNMFFVIVLIVIALGTIFGHKKFQWQTQVPRLLLFAIVINFSKTLAGIMIDFGQVVMLTFANALREIAAGNIIEMFGLNKVSAFTPTAAAFNPTSSKPGTSAWDLAFASLAAVFILSWVLVIMLLLFAILLYRIVALWVLIVLAPLAWFAGGAEILGSSAYADWWKNFKCLVAIGPIVTFFLWLALAVAGAATEGFESSTAGNPASFLTQIFEFQHFMGLVVGSAMLMAGMQTAQQFCSVLSGSVLGKALGKAAAFGPGALSFGKGAALKTTGWGARKVGGAVRAGGRAVASYGGAWAENKKGLRLLTTRGRAEKWREVGQSSGKGVWGKTVGVFAQRRAEAGYAPRHEEIAKAGEKYKKDSTGTKIAQLQRFEQTGAKTLGGKREAQSLFKDMLGDKDMLKKYEESGGDVKALWGKFGKSMEQDFKGDAGTLDKLAGFKKKYAHVTGSSNDLKTFDDFNDLSNQAVLDKDVRARMANAKVEIKRKGKPAEVMTAADAAEKGYFGADKQALFKGGHGALDDEQLRRADIGSVVQNAPLATTNRAANLAFQDKNVGRVGEIASSLLEQYKKPDTTDAKRFEIAGALDSLKAQLAQQLSSGQLKGAYAKQLKSLDKTLDADRAGAESAAGRVGSDGKPVGSNFGAIPKIAQQADPSAFIKANFANASDARVTDAKAQLGGELNQKTDEVYKHFQGMVGAIEAKKGSLSAEAQGIRKEVDGLWDQFKQVRKASEDRAKAEAGGLRVQAQSKQKDIDRKEDDFSRAASRGADIGELSSIRQSLDALRADKANLEHQASTVESSVDKDPQVISIKQEIEIKERQFSETLAQKDGIRADDDEAAKAFKDAMAQSEEEKRKLEEALAALEALKPPHA